MAKKDIKRFRLFGWLTALAAIFQTVGLIRYINRLPDDWIGIAQYVLTLAAFVLVSIGSLFRRGKKPNSTKNNGVDSMFKIYGYNPKTSDLVRVDGGRGIVETL